MISGLPGTVIKAMAGSLELEEEERFQNSLADLVKQFPRYRYGQPMPNTRRSIYYRKYIGTANHATLPIQINAITV